jgi:quercetin dioxygenase-like cupin family protein
MGVKTTYAFSVYQQTLEPGEGVSPHSHAYAEVLYLLAGAVDFLRIIFGKGDLVRCESGETIIVSPIALHAFFNKTSDPCRLLSISTHLHQAFFDEVAGIDLAEPFSRIPLPEAMRRAAEIASRYHTLSHRTRKMVPEQSLIFFLSSRVIRSLAPHRHRALRRTCQLSSTCSRVVAVRLRKAQRRLFPNLPRAFEKQER